MKKGIFAVLLSLTLLLCCLSMAACGGGGNDGPQIIEIKIRSGGEYLNEVTLEQMLAGDDAPTSLTPSEVIAYYDDGTSKVIAASELNFTYTHDGNEVQLPEKLTAGEWRCSVNYDNYYASVVVNVTKRTAIPYPVLSTVTSWKHGHLAALPQFSFTSELDAAIANNIDIGIYNGEGTLLTTFGASSSEQELLALNNQYVAGTYYLMGTLAHETELYAQDSVTEKTPVTVEKLSMDSENSVIGTITMTVNAADVNKTLGEISAQQQYIRYENCTLLNEFGESLDWLTIEFINPDHVLTQQDIDDGTQFEVKLLLPSYNPFTTCNGQPITAKIAFPELQ